MLFRRSAVLKYFIAAVAGSVLYAEWFIFRLQPMFWNTLECSKNDPTCTRILFVADPQIQGDLAVPFPLNTIFNFDSDRYLKSTFSVVAKSFKPEVIVYMGDITDEGSIASLKQFHTYVKRIFNIFDLDYTVKTVWIPGDNDIGGEYPEPVNKEKLREFEKVFLSSTSYTRIPERNITFFKVNAITYEFSENHDNYQFENDFKIVVSHYPVTTKHLFANKVHKKILPQVYFCAHDHISKYTRSLKTDLTKTMTFYLKDNRVVDLLTNDFIYEVYVPTCSYRMGTSFIGYGAAVLEKNNTQMRYTVYQSPTRFPFLFMYLIYASVLCLYCIIYSASKLCFLWINPYKGFEKLPISERI